MAYTCFIYSKLCIKLIFFFLSAQFIWHYAAITTVHLESLFIINSIVIKIRAQN